MAWAIRLPSRLTNSWPMRLTRTTSMMTRTKILRVTRRRTEPNKMMLGRQREGETLRIDPDTEELHKTILVTMKIEVTAADLALETDGETDLESAGTTRTLATSTQIRLRRFIFRSWTGELGSRTLRTALERLDGFGL